MTSAVATELSRPKPTGELVPFRSAVAVWLRVGLQSFGGPAGQIAVMHRILIEERRWVSEARFLHALNYCMLLPGPEAQQLATYLGWLLHGYRGGLVAGLLFVLPGFVSILALSLIYASYHQLAWVDGIFFGLKAAVLAIVVQAVVRIGKRVLKNPAMVGVSVTAFFAIFLLHVPFPLIIVGAAALGLIGDRIRPSWFEVIRGHAANVSPEASSSPVADALDRDPPAHTRPSATTAVKVFCCCALLWGLPIVALLACLGVDHVLTQEAVFFSKSAVVTFGGAYAVLAYIAQEAVTRYGWLLPGEMLDGLSMAETTPGPLIMVVQFVGFMGAYRMADGMSPWLAGLVGSLVTTWVTFVPCFLWIFVGAPYIEALRGRKSLNAALSTLTAAVVGVILHLAVWFACHTLFAKLEEVAFGPASVSLPVVTSVDSIALAIAGVAFFATFYLRWSMPMTLALAAILGLLARLAA